MAKSETISSRFVRCGRHGIVDKERRLALRGHREAFNLRGAGASAEWLGGFLLPELEESWWFGCRPGLGGVEGGGFVGCEGERGGRCGSYLILMYVLVEMEA